MLQILKTWPEPFQAVVEGRKAYEIRVNDRNFKVGDFLCLLEWDPEDMTYTGREVEATVTYMTPGGKWGIPENLCVMGIQVKSVWSGVQGPHVPEEGTP